jgi:hypothetical protein
MTAIPSLRPQPPVPQLTAQNKPDLVAFRVTTVALSTIAAIAALAIAPWPEALLLASVCLLVGFIASLPPSETVETTYIAQDRPRIHEHVIHRQPYIERRVIPTINPWPLSRPSIATPPHYEIHTIARKPVYKQRETPRFERPLPTERLQREREPVYKGRNEQYLDPLLRDKNPFRTATLGAGRVPVHK